MDSPLPLLAYRLGTATLTPLAPAFLHWRQRRGKEEGSRKHERLAIESPPRRAGPLVWCHAVSVGEMRSLLPLLGALPADIAILLTTTTTTAAALAPPGVFHRYAPLDLPGVAHRFFDHWRPDLLLWTESELWPNLLGEAKRRQIPALLLQGRISARSHRRWRQIPKSAREVLSAFDLVLAQSQADEGRFRDLGAMDVRVSGNLKGAAAPPPVEDNRLAAARRMVGGRRCWVAASTHPGEEAVAVTVHRLLMGRFPDLLTLIAPRHPERAAEVETFCAGLSTSRGESPTGSVHIVDRLGELGLWYRLAEAAYLGGSHAPIGGHNPFEPASLGLPLLHGPNTWNFADAFIAMGAAGAALKVEDSDGLAAALGELLEDPARRRRMGTAAQAEAAKGGAVLDTVLLAIDPWIRRLSGGS